MSGELDLPQVRLAPGEQVRASYPVVDSWRMFGRVQAAVTVTDQRLVYQVRSRYGMGRSGVDREFRLADIQGVEVVHGRGWSARSMGSMVMAALLFSAAVLWSAWFTVSPMYYPADETTLYLGPDPAPSSLMPPWFVVLPVLVLLYALAKVGSRQSALHVCVGGTRHVVLGARTGAAGSLAQFASYLSRPVRGMLARIGIVDAADAARFPDEERLLALSAELGALILHPHLPGDGAPDEDEHPGETPPAS